MGFVNIRSHVFFAVHTTKNKRFKYGFTKQIYQIGQNKAWHFLDLILDHWTTCLLNHANIWSHSMHQNTCRHWESITEQTMIMKMKNEKTRFQSFSKCILAVHSELSLLSSRPHCWQGNLRHWTRIQRCVICLEEAKCSRLPVQLLIMIINPSKLARRELTPLRCELVKDLFRKTICDVLLLGMMIIRCLQALMLYGVA